MDHKIFLKGTFETWRQISLNVYAGQLTYAYSSSKPVETIEPPEHTLEGLVEVVTREGVEGLSIPIGRIKLIASNDPVIVASP
jgi:hypothetical protein